MTNQADLKDELLAILARQPGQTTRELTTHLETSGWQAVDRRAVNQVLYRSPDVFIRDAGSGEEAPRWSVAPSCRSEHEAPSGPRSLAQQVETVGPLYAWQEDALRAWKDRAGRGIVEAVTGSGKSRVGLGAMTEALSGSGKVLVLVPTKDLQTQWHSLIQKSWRGVQVGTLGGGSHDDFRTCAVLVAVVNSARTANLAVPRGSLLIADECHRYGSEVNQQALDERFTYRLGLSATYERADDGCGEYLDPYFGGVCFSLDYRRALRDDVIAHFSVAQIGASFSADEQALYEKLSRTCARVWPVLINRFGVPERPFSDFMRAVKELADDSCHAGCQVAREYLAAFSSRRELLAETPVKLDSLEALAPAIRRAHRTIVFTQTIVGAERARERLTRAGVAAGCIHSEQRPDERRQVLEAFRAGALDVMTAAQVLDEGIDVPEADLAIIIAASRTRRQMIQRMGRVLRVKHHGRLARFAILFVENTSEDPGCGAHEAFLEEITTHADATATYHASVPSCVACRFLCEVSAAGARRVAVSSTELGASKIEPSVGVRSAPTAAVTLAATGTDRLPATISAILARRPSTVAAGGSADADLASIWAFLRGRPTGLLAAQTAQVREWLDSAYRWHSSAVRATTNQAEAARLDSLVIKCIEAMEHLNALADAATPDATMVDCGPRESRGVAAARAAVAGVPSPPGRSPPARPPQHRPLPSPTLRTGSRGEPGSGQATPKHRAEIGSASAFQTDAGLRFLDWGTCASCGVRIAGSSSYDLCARCGAD